MLPTLARGLRAAAQAPGRAVHGLATAQGVRSTRLAPTVSPVVRQLSLSSVAAATQGSRGCGTKAGAELWKGHIHVWRGTQQAHATSGLLAGLPKKKADLLQHFTTHRCGKTRGMSLEVKGATEADLGKAQKISLGAGLTAGVFGSIVGVGGGVLIVPMIASACRCVPAALSLLP